ncbi:MAG: glutamate racemase [bacterium]|nr:glutamate racemase [bacterium]
MVVRNKSIGVFDSGFGGLGVLRGIIKVLPEYDYVYLGDTSRAPYGHRNTEDVYKFSQEAVDFLFSKQCELIVFGCNTASSNALHVIQHTYLPAHFPDRKVLGVLIPFSEEAVNRTRNKKVGVMATEATVRSQTFVRELAKLDPTVSVYQQACPLLVPFIEAGEETSAPAREALRSYLAPLIEEHIDTLILGCTHYGLIKKEIQEIVGVSVSLVSEENVVPPRLRRYLEAHPEIESKLTKNGSRRFYTTDTTGRFQTLGGRFFGEEIAAETVSL